MRERYFTNSGSTSLQRVESGPAARLHASFQCVPEVFCGYSHHEALRTGVALVREVRYGPVNRGRIPRIVARHDLKEFGRISHRAAKHADLI